MTPDALSKRLTALCDRIDREDKRLCAMVSDTVDRERLHEALPDLFRRFPVEDKRSALFGRTLGVKDIINVSGMKTRCGTALPAELFTGPEASCVTRLKRAGILVIGKTQTTEFACTDPGPTRNPLNPAHTPGGSSSGSAAAVAAGFFDFALGTQTIGSVIRPAAYCGVVGFKPTQDRVPVDGVFPFSRTMDTPGFFCSNASQVFDIAPTFLDCWGEHSHAVGKSDIAFGIPDDAYLSQADDTIQAAFGTCVRLLEDAGYRIKRTQVWRDIGDINREHLQLIGGEMYRVHQPWLNEFRDRYRPLTIDTIDRGASVDDETLAGLIERRGERVARHHDVMSDNGVDFWLAPPTATLAPKGLDTTGNPIMNLPFTHLGLPTACLPAMNAGDGLKHALQIAAPYYHDEELAALAVNIAPVLLS